jgi:Flp pilus assembly protein TadD
MHARKAAQLDPNDADAQAVLAMALFQHGDMDNALAMAQQALAINPDCALAYRAMGAILIYSGRTAEGREALGVFARFSPRDASIASTQN